MNMDGTCQPQPAGDVGTRTNSWPRGAQHPAGVEGQGLYLAPAPSRYCWAGTPWPWSRFCPCCSGWCCTAGKEKTLGLEGDGNGPSGGIYRIPSSGACACVFGRIWRNIGVFTQHVFGEISMLSPRVLHSLHGGSREALWDRQPLHSCSPNPPQTWREGSRCPGVGLFIKLFVSRAAARPVYLSG